MLNRIATSLVLGAFLFFSCEKQAEPPVDQPPASPYTIVVKNTYNALQAQYAAWLSNADGKIVAYRVVPANDTVHLSAPGSSEKDVFDCTLARITSLETQGGTRNDTSIVLTTYTGVASGALIQLRESSANIVTDLKIRFVGISSLDTIIVPDGLTFVRPQSSNGFSGAYRVSHTGIIWLRVQVNKEGKWRYMYFDKVSGPIEAAVDPLLLPIIFDDPVVMPLPFLSPWKYYVYGVFDTAAVSFLSLGDLNRAPGGFVPVINQIAVYEPRQEKTYKNYRIKVSGNDATNGYTYHCDRFFNGKLPTAIPALTFDTEKSNLADGRLIAFQNSGDFDAVVVSRSHKRTYNISWTTFLKPQFGGSPQIYRLPDVPSQLSARFAPLARYEFDPGISVRAESYERMDRFDAVQKQYMLNADPIWQAKAGYLAKEEMY